MPRLGDVLGSVLAEAARGRVAADTLTRDLVEAYRADPVLSLMSVPRVTVKEMQVTLRFVVDDFGEGPPTGSQPDEAGEVGRVAWERVLVDRVLPRLLEQQGPALSSEELQRVRDLAADEGPAVSAERLAQAVAGDRSGLVDESVEALVDRVRFVPQPLRQRLGPLPQLRQQARAEVAREAAAFLAGQQRQLEVRRILGSRLEVSLPSGGAATDPQVLQEVRVTLEMSDIDTLLAGGALGDEGR